jgi:hypothetical protein
VTPDIIKLVHPLSFSIANLSSTGDIHYPAGNYDFAKWAH